MANIHLLKNTVQEYVWGSTRAIPELLGRPNNEDRPQAELWMGAHPKAPSLAYHNGRWVSLQELISQAPDDILGKTVAKKFNNRLPFLFKVLAAAKPLSIQAHPNKHQAQKGFQRENEQKIPLDAAQRNYRDDNHKPECICALTRFWALSRFRRIPNILTDLQQLNLKLLNDALAELKRRPTPRGLQRFYTSLMFLSQDQKKRIVGEALKKARNDTADRPEFQWMIKLANHYPEDIGVLSPFFLNLIRLEPGQAIYLDAGELHAYLEGLGIELMANSDNVLRGGLTPKHVDVPELLNILDFNPRQVEILSPEQVNECEYRYSTPAEEFVLSVVSVEKGAVCNVSDRRSIEIIICTEGKAVVTDFGADDQIVMEKGMSIIIPAAVDKYVIEGAATLYKASVPAGGMP